MRLLISGGLLAIALAGCSSSPPPEKHNEAPQPTVFDDDLKTMDKAKAAGAQIENRGNDLNHELDQQEGGDTAQPDPNAPKY